MFLGLEESISYNVATSALPDGGLWLDWRLSEVVSCVKGLAIA